MPTLRPGRPFPAQVTTYDIEVDQLADQTLAIFFLVDYALKWYASRNRLAHPSTPWAIIDAVAIAPSIATWAGGNPASFSFVRFFRVFRALRSLRVFRSVRFTPDPVHKQALVVLLTLFSLLFINRQVATTSFSLLDRGLSPRSAVC